MKKGIVAKKMAILERDILKILRMGIVLNPLQKEKHTCVCIYIYIYIYQGQIELMWQNLDNC